MRLVGVATLILMATKLCLGVSEWTGCINPVDNTGTNYRARTRASAILKSAGVKLKFTGDESSCAAFGNGIVLVLSYKTAADEHPGALAYAMPYQGTHVVLFYDRVLGSATPPGVPYLLGHVLAHEITHILQGVERHSASGLMKSKWDYRDYVEMQRRPLGFTDDDLSLIRRGLEYRASGRGSSIVRGSEVR